MAQLLGGSLRGAGTFLTGAPGELELLFGSPAPLLPPGEPGPRGGERIAVEMPARVREAGARWLAAVARSLGGRADAGSGGDGGAEREYHDLLAGQLRGAMLADRRQGIENVFWLALSRELAELIERQLGAPGSDPALRYRAYPILAGLLRRAAESARTGIPRARRVLLELRSGGEGGALMRAIIDDQLALTELDPRAFDAGRALVPENPRFRIAGAAFLEVTRILREQLERGLAAGEAGLRRILASLGPVGLVDARDDEASLVRLVMAEPVRERLLGDLEGTVPALLRSRILQAERRRGLEWPELLGEWADVTRCLRRAEAVAALRAALDLAARSPERRDDRERFLEGRILRFGAAEGGVQSSLRTATMLFADIRGFTERSSGHVSEGDLARELYEIFDPAALVVARFGGTVDKYLGDGFMATFASKISPGAEAIAAVRSAVVLQQVLGRLRRQGLTSYRMGISLHAGRVCVARFLRVEGGVDSTLIGKHVNIAGRLSASVPGGVPVRRVGEVALEREGGLLNHGIAVSGGLLEILRGLLAFEPFHEGEIEGFRCYDRDLALWLNFGYVGEARLRGLEATVPVWSLVPAAPGAAPAAETP